MAVTKRVRFEILRRDNHACRYCGRTAPEVKLTVDHVKPVALGGTDEPSNLVTACADCNAGKSSTSPDAALVEDVRQDALRHAELARQAYSVLVERLGERDDYIDEFAQAYSYTPLPDNWRDSIGRWFEMGVPVEIVVDAAEKACAKAQAFRGHDRFTYMCGIVWKQVRMIDEIAEKYRAVEGRFMSEEALTEERIDAYQQGWNAGEKHARRAAVRNDPLSVVIDRIEYPANPWEVPA